MENVIFFGKGWHNVEHDGVKAFVWNSKESYLEFDPYVESVTLDFEAHQKNSKTITVSVGNNRMIIDVNPGANSIEVETKGCSQIKIENDIFVPSELESVPPSFDTRELGLKFIKICMKMNATVHYVDIKNIQPKSYRNVLQKVTSYKALTRRYKLNTFFDKIYCITCLKDYERQLNVRNQFSKYNVDFEFVSSIHKDNLLEIGPLSGEEYSLCLSHKQCIENAKLNGYSSVAIFEDDFLLEDEWESNFNGFIKELPSNWEFLYLGQARWMTGIMDRRVENVSPFVDKILGGSGSHFVGINSSIYNLCIELLNEFNFPVDICYFQMMKDSNRKCFSPVTSLADALSIPHKKYFDKIPDFDSKRYFSSNLRTNSKQ